MKNGVLDTGILHGYMVVLVILVPLVMLISNVVMEDRGTMDFCGSGSGGIIMPCPGKHKKLRKKRKRKRKK